MAKPYSNIVHEAASKYGVNPTLVHAVIRAESGGNQGARSPAGAVGYMQLMPGTARGLGVNPNDGRQNIMGGTKYLSQQLKAFGGNVDKALAAYNAGPGNVRKYGGIPPFNETQNYVKRIKGFLNEMGGMEGGATAGGSTTPAPTASPTSSAATDVNSPRAQYKKAMLASMFEDSPIMRMALERAGAVSNTDIIRPTAQAAEAGDIEGGAGGSVVDVAMTQVGKTSKDAMRYIKAAGGSGYEPWCGDFVQWVFKQRGLTPPPARSVPNLMSWANKQNKVVKNPRPGDLVTFDWHGDGTPDHVEIVRAIKNGRLLTVGGNTSGSKSSSQVEAKDRGSVRGGSIHGYVRA